MKVVSEVSLSRKDPHNYEECTLAELKPVAVVESYFRLIYHVT